MSLESLKIDNEYMIGLESRFRQFPMSETLEQAFIFGALISERNMLCCPSVYRLLCRSNME